MEKKTCIFGKGVLLYLGTKNALLAQLDRASGYGPEGQGFESLTACHLFITLKMPLAKKPVASPFSGGFEARKNSCYSKDAKALFRGGKGIRTVCSPSNKSKLKRKRRSAVPLLTRLQDGDFLFSAEKEMYMKKEINSKDRPAKENYRQFMHPESASCEQESPYKPKRSE